jgi:hypothetical protein
LVANGHDVAVVGYHVSDNLSNTYSEARANYYQTYYIPDTWFDGVINLGIGNYNQFLAKVNQRLAIPSVFQFQLTVLMMDWITP